MENQLQKRKRVRLKDYDYSTEGLYFVTFCTKGKKKILSKILEDTGCVIISDVGEIVKEQLLDVCNRYDCVKVVSFVIMPNHVHALVSIEETAGASPRPTIMDVVCVVKSLSTRLYRKKGYKDNIFQTSFYEHIVRNEKECLELMKYIEENPLKWNLDELYV